MTFNDQTPVDWNPWVHDRLDDKEAAKVAKVLAALLGSIADTKAERDKYIADQVKAFQEARSIFNNNISQVITHLVKEVTNANR